MALYYIQTTELWGDEWETSERDEHLGGIDAKLCGWSAEEDWATERAEWDKYGVFSDC